MKITKKLHQRLYNFTNIFSRARINQFIDEQVTRINRCADQQIILNIGSGGLIGKRINEELTKHVVNIDMDISRAPDVVSDVSCLCVKDSSVDSILMLEVLEHVKSPYDAVEECYRVLRKGGYLCASVPFIFEIHDRPFDYHRFTNHGLQLVLDSFESISIEPRNSYLESILVLLLRLCMSPHRGDRVFAFVVAVVFCLGFPAFYLMNKLVRSDASTSGYLIKCRK